MSAFPELNVSRETIERLDAYEGLLKKWNPAINLVSKSTLHDARHRHIHDSLQLAEFLPNRIASYADLGTGGGLPGIVLAIYLQEKNESCEITLVESDARKCAFLRTAAVELGLQIDIQNARIEGVDPLIVSVLTSRALAPLDKLLGYVARHLDPDGRALLPKGKSYVEELNDARKNWSFDLKTHQSKTDEEAVILEISNLKLRDNENGDAA